MEWPDAIILTAVDACRPVKAETVDFSMAPLLNHTGILGELEHNYQ